MSKYLVAPRLASATQAWRRAVVHAVLVLGLTVSGVADACTLDALLRLPLERLLELRIGAQRVSQGAVASPARGQAHPGAPHVA